MYIATKQPFKPTELHRQAVYSDQSDPEELGPEKTWFRGSLFRGRNIRNWLEEGFKRIWIKRNFTKSN